MRWFHAYSRRDFGGDLIAGLSLAAIALPQQMATARLGGFSPEYGFIAFIAAALAFAVFGASRLVSVGADSTITPLFAGGLAVLGAASPYPYGTLVAVLALLVGVLLVGAGLFRMGWIADLLSVPVTQGFFTGIAAHIVVSQMPSLLGVAAPRGSLLQQATALAFEFDQANLACLGLGSGVFLTVMAAWRISPRIPAAFLAVAGATACVLSLGLEHRGVAVLGPVPDGLPRAMGHFVDADEIVYMLPLAVIVALVIMVQTAATTRSFVRPGEPPKDLNHDFIGIGAGNLLSGLLGSMPVNASPPQTAIVQASGGRSRLAPLVAALLVLGVAMFGASLFTHVPTAALAGILLAVAVRLVRFEVIADIYRYTPQEFLLILVTAMAIVALPIEIGAAMGIGLSLIHGMWTTTRAGAIELERVPGTTVWWPSGGSFTGEIRPGVAVVAFQAPLSFLNAHRFARDVQVVAGHRKQTLRLVVLEASSIAEIDYTAAEILAALIRHYQSSGIGFAVARLESIRARMEFDRFGLTALLGDKGLFQTVEEAVRALAGPEDAVTPHAAIPR